MKRAVSSKSGWACAGVGLLCLSLGACGPAPTQDSVGQDGSALSSTALPGAFEAEAYQAFSDSTPKNLGGQYRKDAVDLEACQDQGGGYDVGWIAAGEWLEYAVSTATAGTFTFTARVASNVSGTKALHLRVDGVDLPRAAFTQANGWQSWSDLSLGAVHLAPGSHTVRILMETSGFNLNRVSATLKPDRVPPRWGVSGVSPQPGETWPQAYARQVRELGAAADFYYFSAGKNPVWNANLASIPDDHDIIVSTKVADLQAIQTFVDQVPRDRRGLVYVVYWQEPEDDFSSETQAATYRARASAMAPIIKAHPRMRFGAELMAWSLNPKSGRNWKDWVVPQMQFIGWSIYGLKAGDADTAGDGKQAVDAVADVMDQDGRPWGAFGWGVSLDAANYTAHDRALRAQWLLDSAAELTARGATHALWFNIPWGTADFTIQTDDYLMDAWRAATGLP